MSLTACTTNKFIAPPAALLKDCDRTDIPLNINGDLVLQIRAHRVDIANCSADKASLRKWASDMGANR